MDLKIIFQHDISQTKLVEYAFNMLFSSFDCSVITQNDTTFPDDARVIFVSYGKHIPRSVCKNHLHIFADSTFWENLGRPQSLPRSPLHRFPLRDLQLNPNQRLEDPLICPYVNDNRDAKPIYWQRMDGREGHVLVCTLDLLASVLFWLTRYEETLSPTRDEFGRIPEDQLLCVRERCYTRPLVDEYTEALCQLLNQCGGQVSPKREAFRVLITHDVDSGIPLRGGLEYFENGVRSLYREVVREHRLMAGLDDCLRSFAAGLGLRSYLDTFRKIMQIDKQYGYTSHFFLMANGTHSQDAIYDCSSEYTANVIREIHAHDCQVGIHLGINSHQDPEQFRTEWSNLRKVVPHLLPASRSHFLVFQVPHTWTNLAEIGCRVDTTLGFSKYVGFRAATARPYRPYDRINQCTSTVWEYPLTLMDKNLFASRFRSDSKKIEEAIQIIDKVAAHGGCLVINWHNAYFFSDYLSMYTAILKYISEERGQDICLGTMPEPEQKLIW